MQENVLVFLLIANIVQSAKDLKPWAESSREEEKTKNPQ